MAKNIVIPLKTPSPPTPHSRRFDMSELEDLLNGPAMITLPAKRLPKSLELSTEPRSPIFGAHPRHLGASLLDLGQQRRYHIVKLRA